MVKLGMDRYMALHVFFLCFKHNSWTVEHILPILHISGPPQLRAGRCSHGRRRRKPLAACSDFLRGHRKLRKMPLPEPVTASHISFFDLCCRMMRQFPRDFLLGFLPVICRQEGQEPKWPQWEYAPGVGRGMVATLDAL